MKVPFFKTRDETVAPAAAEAVGGGKSGFLASLKHGLSKTRSVLTLRIDELLLGRKEISGTLLDEL